MRRPALAVALLLASACTDEQARQHREEAGRVNLAVRELIDAPTEHKAPRLAALEAMACGHPDTCKAKASCEASFRARVESRRIQLEVTHRARAGEIAADEATRELDRAEKLNAEFNSKNDACLAALAELRQAHKL